MLESLTRRKVQDLHRVYLVVESVTFNLFGVLESRNPYMIPKVNL